MNEDNIEYFYITYIIFDHKLIMEKLLALSFGLYHTTIKSIESYVVVNQKFNNSKVFVLWHDRLGHLGSLMIHQIIEHSHGHSLKNQKIFLPHEYSCVACLQGKLIVMLMTRGMVKSKYIDERKWVIRSQTPMHI